MARGRPRKNVVENNTEVDMTALMERPVKEVQALDLPIDEMPLETMADYKAYNRKARELNKKARELRYPVKPAPLSLHPKQRVVFARKDQPNNPLPVYLSTDMIEYRETLYPGKVYDLPVAVLKFLAEKGTPVWNWFENADGSKETRVTHLDPRFALRTVYED